jgi:hypothetical protein
MAKIQNIACKQPARSIRVTKTDMSVSVFYRLMEDASDRSSLQLSDFQAGDSVEVDPMMIPETEDVILFEGSSGTLIFAGSKEAANHSQAKYLGVVVTHLRPWTERRRSESRLAHTSQRRNAVPKVPLTPKMMFLREITSSILRRWATARPFEVARQSPSLVLIKAST